MKWAIGIGISLSCLAGVSAGEPVSVYPPSWVVVDAACDGPDGCAPPKCAVGASCGSACGTNLWDASRDRFGIGRGCGPRCANSRTVRSRDCAKRVIEWLTWKAGPAVIPKHVPTPYPGNFLSSFPCAPCRQYTPAAHCAPCNTCGQYGRLPTNGSGPLPPGGYRGLPGGPVLMSRGGPPAPPFVSSTPVPKPTPKPQPDRKVEPEPPMIDDPDGSNGATDVSKTRSQYEPRLVSRKSSGGLIDRIQEWYGTPEEVTWTVPVRTSVQSAPMSLYPPAGGTRPASPIGVMTPARPFTNP